MKSCVAAHVSAVDGVGVGEGRCIMRLGAKDDVIYRSTKGNRD